MAASSSPPIKPSPAYRLLLWRTVVSTVRFYNILVNIDTSINFGDKVKLTRYLYIA